jgi:protein-disulfide isomerase
MRELQMTRVRFSFVAALLAALFVCTFDTSCNSSAQNRPTAADRSISVLEHGVALGNPTATVTIEVYSDFQCPFCKEFADKVQSKIFEDYVATGKVQIVYHAFGNWVSHKVDGNTESQRTAEAAYFAADQNRFWQLHDLLFALQGQPNSGVFTDQAIVSAATQAGLDGSRLEDNLSKHTYAGRVQGDYEEGIARGVTSVPTFFVNGYMIVGAQPYEVFKNAIDTALSAAP